MKYFSLIRDIEIVDNESQVDNFKFVLSFLVKHAANKLVHHFVHTFTVNRYSSSVIKKSL